MPDEAPKFNISFAEVLQALGVFGAIGFLLAVDLKVFKLLPTEARNHKHPTPAE